MLIDRVTVSLSTSRPQAAYLQQQVSQLMQQLTPQLAALLARYLPADAPVLEQLRVDIGTLPLSQFAWQFAPRLLAALEQALQQQVLSPEGAFVIPSVQGQDPVDQQAPGNMPEPWQHQGDLPRDAPGASPVAAPVPPEWPELIGYLSHGYWPAFATVPQPAAQRAVKPAATTSEQAEQSKFAPANVNARAGSARTPQQLLRQRLAGQPQQALPGVNARAGSARTPQQLLRQRLAGQPQQALPGVNARAGSARTPQQLLRQRLAGQPQQALPGVNARAGSARTPQQLLRQRLAGQPELAPAERAALIGALQLPGARQRLLRLMTASDWQQLCARLAPAARLSTPSPLALLLLLWQQPKLPALHLFSAAELRPPQPQELRELERLLTADHPQHLLALQPWLEQQAQQRPTAALTVEVGLHPRGPLSPPNQRQDWQQRLSARAQQQLARLKPQTGKRPPPKPKPQPLPEQLELHHAGLVLLWPLLPGWLRSLGQVVQAEPQAPLRFSGPEAQQQAIALLDVLIWQDEAGGEWRSLCSKLLCGWPLEWPLEQEWSLELAQQQAQQLEPALQALLFQLPGLKNVSLSELRQLFLQRPGTLEQQRYGWRLSVSPHPADILLRHIPWPLEQIHYSWLPEPITLNWPRPDYGVVL